VDVNVCVDADFNAVADAGSRVRVVCVVVVIVGDDGDGGGNSGALGSTHAATSQGEHTHNRTIDPSYAALRCAELMSMYNVQYVCESYSGGTVPYCMVALPFALPLLPVALLSRLV
jgi:hypothetical protein